MVYALAKRLIGRRSAPIAAFLVAVHPLLVRYSQEARGYSLLVLVSTLSTLLLLRAIERPTMPRWVLYGALTGLSLYVHLFALVVVPAHCLLALLHIRSIGRPAAVVAGFGSAFRTG
ncbi:hypothetical protein BH24CHL10_BH24CHL10_01530 [soil metagenome]